MQPAVSVWLSSGDWPDCSSLQPGLRPPGTISLMAPQPLLSSPPQTNDGQLRSRIAATNFTPDISPSSSPPPDIGLTLEYRVQSLKRTQRCSTAVDGKES